MNKQDTLGIGNTLDLNENIVVTAMKKLLILQHKIKINRFKNCEYIKQIFQYS